MALEFDPATIQRLLIYRLGSLGDTIVALPALHLVERAFPGARRFLLTNIPIHAKAPAAAAVLGGSGLVHDYLTYRVGTRNPLELAGVWWAIRRFRPQAMVYLAEPRGEAAVLRDEKFFRLCGIRHIVGLPHGELATLRMDPDTGLYEQEAARLLRCVRALGEADVNDLSGWDLHLTPEERQKAEEVLAPIGSTPKIAFGPGTKMQSNDWGRENWRALLDKLAPAMAGRALVMVGAKEDAPTVEFAAANWQGPVLNVCGRLTPRETAAVLHGAELFLGPDSGPKHLAASQGVPCALVFGARNKAGQWYPPGRGHRVVRRTVDCAECRLEVCIEQKKKCLTSITPDDLYEAAIDVWNLSRERAAAGPG